ncbi:MAG: hypothetical protein K8R88_12120 [Armatimonadetes bacterium]|nr:hypothetical protein [Armatimonadota bacterium]
MQKKLLALLAIAAFFVMGCNKEEVTDSGAGQSSGASAAEDGSKDSGANLTVNPDYKGK